MLSSQGKLYTKQIRAPKRTAESWYMTSWIRTRQETCYKIQTKAGKVAGQKTWKSVATNWHFETIITVNKNNNTNSHSSSSSSRSTNIINSDFFKLDDDDNAKVSLHRFTCLHALKLLKSKTVPWSKHKTWIKIKKPFSLIEFDREHDFVAITRPNTVILHQIDNMSLVKTKKMPFVPKFRSMTY